MLSVHRSIVVDAAQVQAFDTFVAMTTWWPLATHTIGEAPARASIVEPRTGGRWYDVDKNGVEHTIGRVLAYEPPGRLLLSWEISCGWEHDPHVKTEVEVRFVAETPARTRVSLEHRGFESYGDRAAEMHERYSGDDAWTYVFGCYANAVRTGGG